MPFKAINSAPQCPKCQRSVYAAEEKMAGGHKWHKACFKCSMCNKILDSTNCAEHNHQLYCKVCYGRRFGPKGVGFGQGAGTLSMDTFEENGDANHVNGKDSRPNNVAHASETNAIKAPKGEGCPNCEGYVYHADQVFSKGKVYHKECFKCSVCHRVLDSRIASDGPDGKIYCTDCFKLVDTDCWHCGKKCWIDNDLLYSTQPCQPIMLHRQPKKKSFKQLNDDENNQEEYFMQKADGSIGSLLKICDTLRQVSRDLKQKDLKKKLENEAFDDKGCYRKNYSIKGYGYGQGGPALMSADIGESHQQIPRDIDTATIQAAPGEGCPRCGGQVFHAEQMFSKGNVYHKKCFKCKQCTKPLDSMLCCDGPDKNIYCKGCYAKIFGAKGYGYGGGKGFLQCNDLDGSAAVDRPNLNPDPSSIQGSDGGKDTCPRCGGQVFHAEKMLTKKNVFHKQCFSCFECKRPLDSTLCCDAPNGEIYCKPCYGKFFGPKGYGFGGAGTMPALMAPSHPSFNDSDRIQVDFLPKLKEEVHNKSKDGCPRCGHAVYEAEKLIAAKKSWHKRCFTCGKCQRHLDSTTVNDAPDSNIYCKACYGSMFGMRGYGFGAGAGTLTTEGAFGEKIAADAAFILP